MRLFVLRQFVFCLCGLIALPLFADTPEGFEPLFNGKNLDGWHGQPQMDPRKWDTVSDEDKKKHDENMRAHWSVEDGVIVNDGHGVFLTTDKEYGDIELLLEYKTVPKADSGIYLRGTPQVQIWDFTEEAKFNLGADKGSGGLWNSSKGAPGKDPLVLADKPFGEWNAFRIVQVGARTSVWLNGKQVVDHAIMENFWERSSPLFNKGVIQLQTHGGEIQWRNLYIRELTAEESNKRLANHEANADQYKVLFNGKDLSGWAGALANYEVVDGAIQCRVGKGGVLHTEEEYSNFSARMEFQLPPGGNNGLAIRYPGSGDTAYVGMCELQVLDNTAKKYAKLDQRQYHGSAYGMIAAKRGYLRAPGEWNYQRVTVNGSKIQVELNGTVILDGDLAEVTDYMANSPHPGKERTQGYFGFAGHSDPVRFRSVEIMSLDN
ncbi:MAG: DUF1080 domain-containing protein [Planctomycetota bacterium]